MNFSFFKRNASTILTCVSVVGVITSGVLAVKATPKAMRIIEEAEKEKGDKLTKFEIIKAAGPAYIPAVAIGVTTIACILGIDILGKRQQASLASAYAVVSRSYEEYKKKVAEICGEDIETDIEELIERDHREESDPLDEFEDGNLLFFDLATMRYFRTTLDQVIQKTPLEDGMEAYVISTPFSGDIAMGIY